MTSKKLGIALLSLVVLAIFAVAPAVADNTYAPNVGVGDTIVVGESGLNLNPALDPAATGTPNTTIAWYAGGSQPGTDTPAKILTLTPAQINSFYVSAGDFENYPGIWYTSNDGSGDVGSLDAEAFRVAVPSLKVGLYRGDGITTLDGKKIVADNDVMVRLDTTFATLFQRQYNLLNNGTTLELKNATGKLWNITPAITGTPAEIIAAMKATGNTTLISVANSIDLLVDPFDFVASLEAELAAVGYMPTDVDDVFTVRDTKNSAYTGVGVNVYTTTPNNGKLEKLIVTYSNGTLIRETNLQKQQPNVGDYWINGVKAAVWSAGRIVDIEDVLSSKILTGEYKFQAEINVNGMKDNLGSVSGKTVSNTATLTIDKESVTITADKATVIRNKGFSVKVEGNPKSDYVVWFTGVNGYNYEEVPAFVKDQKDVAGMSYTQADNTSYKASTVISTDLPNKVRVTTYPEHDYTSNYAVVATLNAEGVINLAILTNENTKDTTYTIRAQRILGYVYENGVAVGYKLDDQLYDTAKVKVEKGAVTVSASGDGSYYLGEEVTLSGTNTDSDDIYLFITGPNLPVAGGKLDDPKRSPTADDSTVINVKNDDTWEYKWDTSGSVLDAGTYTIYATSDFALKSGTNKTLSDVKYDTVSVVIKKPFVTATTSASTVAKGDKLFIRGTAEGEPTAGVAIWILGKNYWNGENTDLRLSTMVTETVNDDGSFEYELGSADTKDLASGQYFVVVQHPMYNGVFDVKTDYYQKEGTVQVITNPKGTEKAVVNGQAFIIAGNGKLQGSDAAEALIQAINSANVDDTYTKLTFLVEEPWIRVNSVGDHYIGDQFKITGTTNLAVGDNLIVEVTSSSFQPTQKTQSGEFSGVSSTVKVTEGSSYNEWALDVDASTFKADEYIVNVEAIEADCTTTTTFNILTGSATVAPTSGPTTAPTTAPTSAPTTAPTPAATASPGFGALVALIGLGAVAALIIRKD